jgi:hypothetical protein
LAPPLNNASVIRPVARAAALFVVAPFLTFVSALASQHIHEPEPGHEHEHAVAHSHFAPHHVDVHDHHDADADLDHDDAHVVWLDSSTLNEFPYQVHHVPAAVPVSFEAVPIRRDWSVTPFDDAAPLHGPPKQPSLFRGPPLPAV